MAKRRGRGKEPKKRGRPSEYRPHYCAMLVDHMKDGLSFESFAGVIGKDQDTLHQWMKKHRAFAEARKKGDAVSLLFWEKIGIAGMAGKIKGFNPTSHIFNMHNRFRRIGWRRGDVHEEGPKEENPATLDAINELEREERTKKSAPDTQAEPAPAAPEPGEAPT
jgi:hypothetical protein